MTENMVNENNMTRPTPNTAPEFFGSRQYKMSAAKFVYKKKYWLWLSMKSYVKRKKLIVYLYAVDLFWIHQSQTDITQNNYICHYIVLKILDQCIYGQRSLMGAGFYFFKIIIIIMIQVQWHEWFNGEWIMFYNKMKRMKVNNYHSGVT